MEYKCRAECMHDVMRLITIGKESISIIDMEVVRGVPDVEVIFNSSLNLQEIIELMAEIPDSHVMYQTVKPTEFYTGKRDYDLIKTG